MCGIIGIVGTSPVAGRLIESLRRLEYRGYDSAGVAVLQASQLEIRRAPGKLRNLEGVLAAAPVDGRVGLGHTRWATHGPPTERNAHPHRAGRVVVVHNGIIENFAELKRELIEEGRTFASDTDTEVVAHLIDRGLTQGLGPLPAFQAMLAQITGAYALAALIEGEPDLILGARHGPPLVVGFGDGEMFLGSDAVAVGPFTQRIAYLEDGDHVAVYPTGRASGVGAAPPRHAPSGSCPRPPLSSRRATTGTSWKRRSTNSRTAASIPCQPISTRSP